jgi:hypothetical protein
LDRRANPEFKAYKVNPDQPAHKARLDLLVWMACKDQKARKACLDLVCALSHA